MWSVRRTPNQAIVTENNIPFVKIGFPVRDGLTWDGNVLNIMDEETYSIDGIGIPLTTENNTFNTTLNVIHSDVQDTIIRFDQRSVRHHRLLVPVRRSTPQRNKAPTNEMQLPSDRILQSPAAFYIGTHPPRGAGRLGSTARFHCPSLRQGRRSSGCPSSRSNCGHNLHELLLLTPPTNQR